MSSENELNKSSDKSSEMQNPNDQASQKALHEIYDKGASQAFKDMHSQSKSNCELPNLSIGNSSLGKSGDTNSGSNPGLGGKRSPEGSAPALEMQTK